METAALVFRGAEGSEEDRIVRVVKDNTEASGYRDEIVLTASDVPDITGSGDVYEKALLVAALRTTGVRRFRYLVDEAFTKGDYQLSFAAGAFKHVDATSEEGVTTPGVANEDFTLSFVVERRKCTSGRSYIRC